MRISDWSSDVCSSDLYLDAMRAKIAAVTARLGELTNHVPGAEVVVKPVEPWLEASAGTAGYFAPSAHGSRPGILYVTTRDMSHLPICGVSALAKQCGGERKGVGWGKRVSGSGD